VNAKPTTPQTTDQQEPEVSQTPPKQDPKKAAGSLNPKEKAPFYEAIVRQSAKRGKRK
jgi:hypothetical protein